MAGLDLKGIASIDNSRNGFHAEVVATWLAEPGADTARSPEGREAVCRDRDTPSRLKEISFWTGAGFPATNGCGIVSSEAPRT